MAFSSVRSINFSEKKRFLLFWICDSVALAQFCKLISFCIYNSKTHNFIKQIVEFVFVDLVYGTFSCLFATLLVVIELP